MAAPTNGKDVIYVDVDDEITTVIDKVASSKDKIVALVLPKRASVFQSIVNMKLLKHRADSAKKHLVLITSETGLLPLAGSAGIHVASTLQSKPEIPVGPLQTNLPDDINEDEAMSLPADDFDAQKDGAKSVGDLAKTAGAGGVAAGAAQEAEDTIELDNSDLPDGGSAAGDSSKAGDVAALAAAGGAGKGGKKSKNKKDKNLKIPNFEKFRLKIVLAVVVLILLIIAFIVANDILPKAVVTIKTDTSSINTSLTPTLNTTATTVSTSTQVVPASTQQVQKSYTQAAPATGQKNNGQQATGTVTMSIPCADVSGQPPTIPAGTGLSANGLTFVTDSATALTNASFQGGCSFDGSTSVTAQQGGTQYNIQPTTFSVAGYSTVTATSSAAFSGGTDNIQTIVQQSDITGAEQKLAAQVNKNAIESQLEQTLKSAGEYPIVASFTESKPTPTASAAVGAQTSTVTVSESVTYTMFGARKSDLQKLINHSVDQQIDTTKQSIQSDGFNHATITVPNTGSGSTLQIDIQTTSTVGPQLNLTSLKQQILGMKSGQVQTLVEGDPGVKGVTVKFSPFWVDSVPKHADKISFVFQKA